MIILKIFIQKYGNHFLGICCGKLHLKIKRTEVVFLKIFDRKFLITLSQISVYLGKSSKTFHRKNDGLVLRDPNIA